MFEFKFGPLMLFLILLLILIAASFYSNRIDGFANASDSNPFESLSDYDTYYKGLANISNNFYYDPKNGNI